MKRFFRFSNTAVTIVMLVSAVSYCISAGTYIACDGIVSDGIVSLGAAGGTVFISSIFANLLLVVTEHTFVKA